MIIVLKPGASKKQKNHILDRIKDLGFKSMISEGVERTIIGVIGEEEILRATPLEAFPGVERVIPVLKPYKLVSREFKPENTVVDVSGVAVGGKKIVIIAGPCAVESREMIARIGREVKRGGADILRGGAYKPRTSPYAFQGLGKNGMKYLAEAGRRNRLPVVTEVMDTRDVGLVEKAVDLIQIGARNMQNFNLLKRVGKAKKPILLKRGPMSTIKEFLMSAEYILTRGNFNVILCERGIRTFENATRNTLDLSAVPIIKNLSHLPVIVDPSHATGRRDIIPAVSRAAIAAGADGIMVEVHHDPENALSDGPQSMTPREFSALVKDLKRVTRAVGRAL